MSTLNLYDTIPSLKGTPYKVVAYGKNAYVAIKIIKSSITFHVYPIREFLENHQKVLSSLGFINKIKYYTLTISYTKKEGTPIIVGGILFALLPINQWDSPWPTMEKLS